MFAQEGRGDPCRGGQSTGWALGFKQAAADVEHLRDVQHHLRASDEVSGPVDAVSVEDARGSGQHGMAVATDDFSRNARRGQPPELFRANRAPVVVVEILEALGIGFALAVVTGAEADQAGADQAAGFCAVHKDYVRVIEAMAIRKREEDGVRDSKMLWLIGSIVVIVFLVWIVFAPGRGFFHYVQLHREISSLAEENARLEAKNVELAEDIKKLQSDNAYLEKIAREKHGLLKKDEMVFDFNRPAKKK